MSDVVICVHNEATTLGDIVDAALKADIGKVIVVIDSSTDDSLNVADAHRKSALVLLQGNYRDKGSAVEAGVSRVSTPRTVLFDSDLLNVVPDHFRQLDVPSSGQVVGIRGGSFKEGKSFNVDPRWSIGGERCLPTDVLRSVQLHGAGYRLEMRVNKELARRKLPSHYVWLDGLKHRSDMQKVNIIPAIKHDIVRWYQVGSEFLKR